jgi:hypothetical protein
MAALEGFRCNVEEFQTTARLRVETLNAILCLQPPGHLPLLGHETLWAFA